MKKRVIVIGGGHNGLICATYLAKAGHPVTVLESRSMVGGCAVTEEIYPGFKFSRAAYVQSLLRPRIIKDLELERWGLKFIPRKPVASFTPMPDGRSLALGHDMRMNVEEISRFSKRDAQKYPEFEKFLARIANAIEPLLDAPPPDMKIRSFADLHPWFLGLRAAIKLGRIAPQAARLLLAPARELLDEWFDSEPLKGTLGTDAIIGAFASPSSLGTGYVLFHHVMGGIWSYVEGGMGGLSDALLRSATASGVHVVTNAHVDFIYRSAAFGRFTVMTKEKQFSAEAVVSSLDLKATFDLVEDSALPETYRRALATIDYRSPVVKYNFALDRLPEFKTELSPFPLTGTIHMGALTLDELDTAYSEAVAGHASTNPMVEMTIPSVLDKTLAPEGKHVASAFVQYAPILSPDDQDWSLVYQDITAGVLRAVDAVAPGFSDSILHMEVLAAPDLERVFGLTGGNIFHGAMTPDRLAIFRPFPGWANYTTPIPYFFLCGSGTHPGGGVMGAPGRNAAGVITRKL